MNEQQSGARSILHQLGLDPAAAPNLPPELRDELLALVLAWGDPQELLDLTDTLRTVHGPLLFLLDYEAQALFKLGRFEDALGLIERRQRRSTSAATQTRNLQVLWAAGHEQHARSAALELTHAHPRNSEAVVMAADVLAQAGEPEAALAALQTLLTSRPHDLPATLALVDLTHHTQGRDAADAQLQALGAGIPAGIDDEALARLQLLAQGLGRKETAAAAALELQRRRRQQLEQLHSRLLPFIGADSVLASDPEHFYLQYSGPQSVAASKEERKEIEYEAIRQFGFDTLRSGQVETMAAALRGESILTVMPTGAGKSLCYQLPALMLPHATLVISPLIALMKDQVEGLPRQAQALATFINSTLSDEEVALRMKEIAQGKYKLIYAAPERLRQRPFLATLRQAQINLFVVDEAHCVSMWGHDFRPDYLFIQEARRELGDPAALAITATAPPRVRDEIIDYISSDQPLSSSPTRPHVMALDVFRSNLHLSAFQFHNEDEKRDALLKFVAETPGSGIAYVNSRNKAERLAGALKNAGVQAAAYHAGMSGSERTKAQDRFMRGDTRVMVATIAFGMGIDKADIRFIVHFHPSRSLDSYYQEVGRAGRDGLLSQGVLFYSINDWANFRRWAKSDEQSLDLLKRVYAAIGAQLDVVTPGEEESAVTAITGAMRAASGPVEARRLQQVAGADETSTRVAISLLERADLLTRGFDLFQELTVGVPKRLPADAAADKALQRLRKGLSLQPGQSGAFATADIARFMHWDLYEVEPYLLQWQEQGWLTVQGARPVMYIQLPPRPPDMQERLERLLNQSAAVAQRRVDDMIGYATSESCRHGYISAHFGSIPRTKCTVCDICTGVRPDIQLPLRVDYLTPDDVDIEPMILDCLVSLPRPVGRSGLARILAGALRAPFGGDKARHFGALKGLGEEAVTQYMDDLVESGRLRQYPRNGYPVLEATLRGRAQAEAWLAEHPELAFYQEAPAAVEPVAGASDEDAAEGVKYTGLQKALWLWRRRTAEEFGQPVYVVMSNETMLRVAEVRPQTLDELALLPGIGGQRLQHYGAALLDIIKLHPLQEGDSDLLATQRETAAASAEEGKTAAGKIRQAVATASSPQLERKILMRLQEIRQKRAVSERSKAFGVASNKLLQAIAQMAPSSMDALEAISGFRDSGLKDDAQQIIAAIAALRE